MLLLSVHGVLQDTAVTSILSAAAVMRCSPWAALNCRGRRGRHAICEPPPPRSTPAPEGTRPDASRLRFLHFEAAYCLVGCATQVAEITIRCVTTVTCRCRAGSLGRYAVPTSQQRASHPSSLLHRFKRRRQHSASKGGAHTTCCCSHARAGGEALTHLVALHVLEPDSARVRPLLRHANSSGT